MARWAELPVSRARFQHRNVSKPEGEGRSGEAGGQAAAFWLWTDRSPGEGPGSCQFHFGGRSGTSCLKPLGGGTSCLEATKGQGIVGARGLVPEGSLSFLTCTQVVPPSP